MALQKPEADTAETGSMFYTVCVQHPLKESRELTSCSNNIYPLTLFCFAFPALRSLLCISFLMLNSGHSHSLPPAHPLHRSPFFFSGGSLCPEKSTLLPVLSPWLPGHGHLGDYAISSKKKNVSPKLKNAEALCH